MTTARYGVTRTPGQLFALAFGAVYALVGVLGFIGPLVPGGKLLGIFGINPLHNVVHLAVGALFLFGSTSPANAKTINLVVGVVYLLVGILGLLNLVVPGLIANNGADTGLHLVTGALALYFGTVGARARSSVTA
ncbi:MAG: DUF4383 domain-containing protein [Egibacteraceae bacterium]